MRHLPPADEGAAERDALFEVDSTCDEQTSLERLMRLDGVEHAEVRAIAVDIAISGALCHCGRELDLPSEARGVPNLLPFLH